MDIQRAFERGVEFRKRIERIERTGSPLVYVPEKIPVSRLYCPGSVCTSHGEPNSKGECPYCGYHLGRYPAPAIRARPDYSIEDRCDPVTMEPVSYWERWE